MAIRRRLFPIVWRINAISILISTLAISFLAISLLVSQVGWNAARRRDADAGPAVAAADGEHLSLGAVALVPGTEMLRGELQAYRSGSGLSSSGYYEVRNYLYLKLGSDASRWLLQDNRQVLAEHQDITADSSPHGPPVATVVLAKPVAEDVSTSVGKLLLLDPAGLHVQTVANNVRGLQAAVASGNSLSLLFERDRRYFLAEFDLPSLVKKGERPVELPRLP